MRDWIIPVFWLMEVSLILSYVHEGLAWLEYVAVVLAIILMVLAARAIPKSVNAWPVFAGFILVILSSEWSGSSLSWLAFGAHLISVAIFTMAFANLLPQLGNYGKVVTYQAIWGLAAMEVSYAFLVRSTHTNGWWMLTLLFTAVFGFALTEIVREMQPRQQMVTQTT